MAASYVRCSDPKPVDPNVMYQLYSYYKQATEGDQYREAPWKINVESYAKWNAWKSLKGMRKDQAMTKYVELLNQVEPALMVSSFMGIFPEINHVWMTIDNQLYLWNYEVQEPICTHEDPDQVIIHVSLVKPLPGIFLEQIEYLLVIATPLEITLLGIAFEEKKKAGRPRGKVKIFRTDLACHADSVNMSSIIGTDQGRIFMRGNDGQLFELVYQGDDGWLTRKIRKLNKSGSSLAVFIPSIFNWAGSGKKKLMLDPIKLIAFDNDRNALYTVTKNNYIELIYLGPDGKGFTRIAKYKDLNNDLNKINAFDDQIIALYPVSPMESRSLHMVVITSSGVRAYFSTNDYSYATTTNPKFIEPKTLKCLFAIPPSNIAGAVNQRIKVHQGYYSNGITITSQALEDIDRILMSAPHAGAIVQGDRKYLVEYAGYCEVEGRTWAIEEVPSDLLSSMKKKPVVGYHLNELATQFEFEPRKFYLLTNGGLHTIVKYRPIDILYQLLSSQSPSNLRVFQDFFSNFGNDQSCAMCLAIAANHPTINQGLYAVNNNIVSLATKLYFELGGVPSMRNSPQTQMGVTSLGVPFSPNDVAHSAKYNGLVLYISRLVRSLWKRELVSKSLSPNGQELLVPTFTSEQLASIQLNLGSLEAFLKLYPKLTAAPTPDTRPTQGDHEAWKIEQQSFAYIHEIIIRTLETISFLSILIDFKIPNLVQNLSEHDRKELISITFDGLVILPKGREVAKALMSALINNQINKEIGAEYVIDSLQKRCPGICESNDVILFKGMENLRTAKSIANQGSSAQLLQDALKYDVIDCRLFLSISKHLTLEKLSEIVENFKQLRFYPGIIDLVLLKSSEYVIPDNLAVDVNNPYNEILDLRQRCYELIFGTFSSISNLGTTGQMSKDQVEKYTKVLLNKALASDDRNFHYSLYTWFINQSWIDKLLEIQSPHFEAFLVEKKRDLVLADYLCRFYVRNNRFFDAAQLLSEIAYYPGLNLDTRLSYLANAIANGKSCTGSNTQELLGQLNDLLDVARIQADIISTLKNIPDTELLLQELDSELLDLATLFSKYARPYEMNEIMLQIFYISETSPDKARIIIEKCWDDIIKQKFRDAQFSKISPFDSLSDKIKELGLKFYPSDLVFPLLYLVNKLEQSSLDYYIKENSYSYGWVARSLLDVKIPFNLLFQVYQSIYESKLPPWSSNEAIAFLIHNILKLVQTWFDYIRSPATGFYERDEFPAREIDEVLSKYLSNLPMDNKSLSNEIQKLQSRLRSAF